MSVRPKQAKDLRDIPAKVPDIINSRFHYDWREGKGLAARNKGRVRRFRTTPIGFS